METKIKLGDKVRCKVTGFIGVAVARTEFLNGCIQYSIAPKWDKKSSVIPEDVGIDEQSLEVIGLKKKKKSPKKEENGGKTRESIKMHGF